MASLTIQFNDNELRVVAYRFMNSRLSQYLNAINEGGFSIEEIRQQIEDDIEEIEQRIAVCETENILNERSGKK